MDGVIDCGIVLPERDSLCHRLLHGVGLFWSLPTLLIETVFDKIFKISFCSKALLFWPMLHQVVRQASHLACC